MPSVPLRLTELLAISAALTELGPNVTLPECLKSIRADMQLEPMTHRSVIRTHLVRVAAAAILGIRAMYDPYETPPDATIVRDADGTMLGLSVPIDDHHHVPTPAEDDVVLLGDTMVEVTGGDLKIPTLDPDAILVHNCQHGIECDQCRQLIENDTVNVCTCRSPTSVDDDHESITKGCPYHDR